MVAILEDEFEMIGGGNIAVNIRSETSKMKKKNIWRDILKGKRSSFDTNEVLGEGVTEDLC